MPVPFDVLEKTVEAKLTTPRNVAKVALYLISYVLDRTEGGRLMDDDRLFQMVKSKLEKVANEPEHAKGVGDYFAELETGTEEKGEG